MDRKIFLKYRIPLFLSNLTIMYRGTLFADEATGEGSRETLNEFKREKMKKLRVGRGKEETHASDFKEDWSAFHLDKSIRAPN